MPLKIFQKREKENDAREGGNFWSYVLDQVGADGTKGTRVALPSIRAHVVLPQQQEG